MVKTLLLNIMALIVAPAVAIAQSVPPTNLAEAERQWSAADACLNSVWQKCVDRESSTVQSIAALRKSQQMWSHTVTRMRAYQLGQSGRQPLDDIYYVHAKTVLTLSRIAELKALFGCQ